MDDAKGYTWFLYFLFFSVIGWIYEVLIVWIEMHEGFVNRGFLFGPWLPVYGFGGLLILLVGRKLRDRRLMIGKCNLIPLVCFVEICLLATVLELLASYLLEWWMGKFLWNYHGIGYGPDFQGRIALRSSLQFGVIGIVILYGIFPLLERSFGGLRRRFPRGYRAASLLMMGVFLADVVFHLVYGSNAQW